jgi:2-polyprenyl-3-methyl-5-hydroxy-6-metoxy-1,4-benzoquinol methylase
MAQESIDQARRHQEEVAFFDHQKYQEGPLPDLTVRRYKELRKPWLPAEYPWSVLGDVRGKRALELGCGDGTNAILLAIKGASVLGIDISPRAVEVARRRARLHGVEDRVQFICQDLESAVESNHGTFDIILGIAVLHHMIPVLSNVLQSLKKLARPDTIFLFAEPVSLSKGLRALRLRLPVPVKGTPGERPLEPEELKIIWRHLPNARVRLNGFLLRFGRYMLRNRNYELSPWFVRSLYDLAARVDNILLSTLRIKWLASSTVICGRPEP